MNKIISLSIWLLAFIPLFSIAQTQKSLVGFQGMPWGSSMSAVRSKFPEAKEFNLCKALASDAEWLKKIQTQFKDKDLNCSSLSIDPYAINGVSYKATFSFSNSGKLENVAIFNDYPQADNSKYLTDCDASYKRLSTAVGINYGSSFPISNPNDGTGYSSAEGVIWVLPPTQITVIKSWNFNIAKDLNKPDTCRVAVDYSRRGNSKL